MSELLEELLRHPERVREAVQGSGMSRQETAALISNLRTVIDKLGRKENYARLQALLDCLETVSEGNADAASGSSSVS